MTWIDPTLRERKGELLTYLVSDYDRRLFLRYLDNPRRLTGLELAEVEDRILPLLREKTGQYGFQPRYRWVDNKTGEVEDG